MLTATNMVLGLRVRRRESRWWNEIRRQLNAAAWMARCGVGVRVILWTTLTLCSIVILPGLLPGLLGGLKAPRVFMATLLVAASSLGTLLVVGVGGVAVSVSCLVLLAYTVVLGCASCCVALARTQGHQYLHTRRVVGRSHQTAPPFGGAPEE